MISEGVGKRRPYNDPRSAVVSMLTTANFQRIVSSQGNIGVNAMLDPGATT